MNGSEPLPPEAHGNPLIGPAIAIIYAILYVLESIRTLVAWLTITLPGIIVRVLQYTLTISLGFTALAIIVVASLIGLTFVIRYRYLARYTQLKETALPPPSPPSLTHELHPLSHNGLGDRRSRSAAFHNYLDDFLAAIKIFGYLEKPVFHELSRHLQTRRLAAGDSIEIGGGEFWCVVEGKVQVFAPSEEHERNHPRSPNLFERTFNGYHLLNEVSTGGTLSSLFSILSLFTEDIKLSWTPPEPADQEADSFESYVEKNDSDGDEAGNSTMTETTFDLKDDPDNQGVEMRHKRRQNSDVSYINGNLGKRMTSPLPGTEEVSPLRRARSMSAGTTSSAGVTAGASPPKADLLEVSTSTPGTGATSPALEPGEGATITPPPLPISSQHPLSTDVSPFKTRRTADMPRSRGTTPGSAPRSIPPYTQTRLPRSGSMLLKGTIARATVDTTLAVIPVEAFKKLTRKFPKASGTIVQVVLERFSRVTFMTAHKFLGLTREILRSESSLNEMVSHPLPREFYSGGGIQALRSRFELPKERSKQSDMTTFPRVLSKDYFSYIPASPTIKAPSLPSATPVRPLTPAVRSQSPQNMTEPKVIPPVDTDVSTPSVPGVPRSADIGWSPEAAKRHSSKIVRQNSAMRKQVAAGDLAMSRYSPERSTGGAYYRKSAQTPGLPRQDTWRGRLSGSTTDLNGNHGISMIHNEGIEQEIEIRDMVMMCIAKSIGLIQPASESAPDSHFQSSLAASVAATSPPSSPMFPPHKRGSKQFGNVLDMLNASAQNEHLVSDMLREAVRNAQVEDDVSNVSASLHESNVPGHDINKSLLRDLEGCVDILYFKEGSQLVTEGDRSPGIYYVIDGFLDVSIPTKRGSKENEKPHRSGAQPSVATSNSHPHERPSPFDALMGMNGHIKHEDPTPEDATEHLYAVAPGGLAGYLASLCATESYVNIRAKTDCFVGFLPTKDLERILERRPIVLLTLAKRLLSLLSPLVLHIDAGLDWIQLNGGQVLYEKGDRSSDIYIVINGRLRSLDDKGDGVKVLTEYGQSDSIGELDVITAVPRSDTVHAIRDSELVRIPSTLFDAISAQHPATTMQFMRLIAGRMRSAMGEQPARPLDGGMDRLVGDVNLKTVCILGASRSVPVAHFAGKLKTSLEELGASTSYLDQGVVMRHLGRHAFARIGQLKIAGWLADQEQHYRSVLYVADTPPSSQWTLTCIRQADLILIVAMGDDPTIGEYEKLLLATKTTARKELILLHDERTVAPGSTRPWLRHRPWLHAHHHVELPGIVTPTRSHPAVHDPAAIAAFKHLREQVETRIKKYRGLRPLRPRRPPHMNDFARIARRLCGKQIGVVLGGGGGRGISHIGMLQALEEYGVPVDAISGCSIGAFVGGQYARETDLLAATGRTKQFSGRMGSMLRILSDVTYPFVAYTTGHEFNRGIYKAFYNTHIEDFWIPFFCNSTNITHSRMEIHRSGYAWRYVRASMTLAGLLPPLSDNGDLLVDGGYMDNTPIGPLRANGIRDIFVVDVGSVEDTSPRNYGDSVSGWWIFLNKFNPFYKRAVLSMTEVSSRLVYVSSVKVLDDVKKDPHCLYLAMPVQQFETLGGFKKFTEVFTVGLAAGRESLRNWKEEGRLPTGMVDEKKGAATVQKATRLRRMSI